MLILSSLLCLLAEPALAATPGIASTLEESSKSTPKQMAEGAAEMVAEVDAAVATVAKLIESAKATRKGNMNALGDCTPGHRSPARRRDASLSA